MKGSVNADLIDIHTHVLSGLDDGADTPETSVEMLRQAAQAGTTRIFCTPHVLDVGDRLYPETIVDCVRKLQAMADNEGIAVELIPGSEIMLTPDLAQRYKNGELCTLGDSKYILVELPMNDLPYFAESVLFDLLVAGLTPILAHPERYRALLRQPETLYSLVSNGVLTQVNSGSLTGLFGSAVRELALDLIDCGLAHFIASDGHSTKHRQAILSEGRKAAEDELGFNVRPLVYGNPLAVVNGCDIAAEDPKPYRARKRPFLSRLFSGRGNAKGTKG